MNTLYLSESPASLANASMFEACTNISERIIAYAKEQGIDAVQHWDREIHDLLVENPNWLEENKPYQEGQSLREYLQSHNRYNSHKLHIPVGNRIRSNPSYFAEWLEITVII